MARRWTGALVVLLAGCRPEPTWSPIQMLSVPIAADASCAELARVIETAGEMLRVREAGHGSAVVPLSETLTVGRETPRGRSRAQAPRSEEWLLVCSGEPDVALAARTCEVDRRSFVVVDLAPLRGRQGAIGDLRSPCSVFGSLNDSGFSVVFRGPTRELLGETP